MSSGGAPIKTSTLLLPFPMQKVTHMNVWESLGKPCSYMQLIMSYTQRFGDCARMIHSEFCGIPAYS